MQGVRNASNNIPFQLSTAALVVQEEPVMSISRLAAVPFAIVLISAASFAQEQAPALQKPLE